jgi:hypothetical protein
MRDVLLRVGIDTGADGISGPLFTDGTFEFIPIPDGHGTDDRTYGNTWGRHGRLDRLLSAIASAQAGVAAHASHRIRRENEARRS